MLSTSEAGEAAAQMELTAAASSRCQEQLETAAAPYRATDERELCGGRAAAAARFEAR